MKKEIILGVSGSIAVYKAADLAWRLVEKGYSVHTVMTRAAAEFISPLIFQTLTKNTVHVDMFKHLEKPSIYHISLAKAADLVILAPATANLIGKLAHGIADDMLTAICTAAWQKPTLLCPAMNTAMYENPIHQENLLKLQKELHYHLVEPKTAKLACGDVGKGAFAEVADIVAAAEKKLNT